MSSAIATTATERDSNAIVDEQLKGRLTAIEQAVDADVLAYFGPISPPADDEIKDAVEEISPRRSALLVIIETLGGYIDTAERVDFVVPSYAMSAGTVLVMSGDAIHMDYASILGPIDPQVYKNGQWAARTVHTSCELRARCA